MTPQQRWNAANKERFRVYQAQWAADHRDQRRVSHRQWKLKNPEWRRDNYRSDANARIKDNLRHQLYTALTNRRSGRDWYRNSKIGPLIACSKPDLIAHIEAQFQPGMSWDNYGRKHNGPSWELDHIKPCASFDLTDPAQQAACFHYTNLRPLWRADNLSRPKGSC